MKPFKIYMWKRVLNCVHCGGTVAVIASSEKQAIRMILRQFKEDPPCQKVWIYNNNTIVDQFNCFEKELRSRKPLVADITADLKSIMLLLERKEGISS